MDPPTGGKDRRSKQTDDELEKSEKSENHENTEKDKSKKSDSSNPYTFKNFMKPTRVVLYAIGLILWPRESYWIHKWSLLNFFISIMAINLDITCELYNQAEFLTTATTLLELTEIVTYIIYTVLSEVKILYIFSNLKQINKLIKTLNGIFPVTENQQAAYNVEEYRRKILFLTFPGVIAMWTSVTFYTGSSVCLYLLSEERKTGADMGKYLQFYFKYPFAIDTDARFFGVLTQQFHSSQIVAFCVTGSEALLTFIVLQVCMHLDALSMRLEKKHSGRGDIKDLSIIVKHHDLILQLMNEVNKTFNVPVFITFLSSTFSMCFVGFQIMNSTNFVDITKFALFITYDVIKVFVTSLLGNMLIDLSLKVGDSAYNTSWYLNTVEYQKAILLIIGRAQKAANLNAITFHEACLISFKEISSKSYTFFTVLHTMYDE